MSSVTPNGRPKFNRDMAEMGSCCTTDPDELGTLQPAQPAADLSLLQTVILELQGEHGQLSPDDLNVIAADYGCDLQRVQLARSLMQPRQVKYGSSTLATDQHYDPC